MQPITQLRPGPSERHAWYALWVLFFVGLLSFLDRTILSILQIPIKAEFGLSDSQLGLMTGMAFAFFYVAMGVPIARLADRKSRKNLIAVSLTVWSLCTIGCAFAPSFIWLLVLRMGLAIGEAGGVSPVHSLLSDYFPPERRTIAMSLWSSGLLIGVMLAFLVGGTLSDLIGWRHTFMAVGLLSLLVAPIIAFTLQEPPRGRFDDVAAPTGATPPPLLEVIRILLNIRTYRNFCLAGGLIGYSANAMLAWNAPFYDRVHGLTLSELAVTLSMLKGGGGVFGVLFGGYIVHRLSKRDLRWFAYIPAFSAAVMIPFAIAQYFVDSALLSLVLAIVPAVAAQVYIGPLLTVVQSVTASNMRAFASAGMAVATSLIGYGLGPTAVGFTSDILIKHFGMAHTSLKWAIALQLWAAAVAAIIFFRSARHIKEEMRLNVTANAT